MALVIFNLSREFGMAVIKIDRRVLQTVCTVLPRKGHEANYTVDTMINEGCRRHLPIMMIFLMTLSRQEATTQLAR